MSPNTVIPRALEAGEHLISDPGNAGTIRVGSRMMSVCRLRSTSGAETRSLAQPTIVGQMLCLCLDTNGGSSVAVTLTGSSGRRGSSYNAASVTALNTLTFDAAAEYAMVQAITSGGTLLWALVGNAGAVAS